MEEFLNACENLIFKITSEGQLVSKYTLNDTYVVELNRNDVMLLHYMLIKIKQNENK